MFTITDGAIIGATLLGPVLAIQVQKYLERWRDETERRKKVFKTLMATRAARLSLQHIEALNLIDLEFPAQRKFKKVRSAWKAYLASLNDKEPESPADRPVFYARRLDLFVDLLYEMGTALGYDFDKTQINKDVYSTVYHGKLEEDQELIRRKLVEILTGKAAFPMTVVDFPSDPEFIAAQTAYFKLLAENLHAGKPQPVAIVSDPGKVIAMRTPEQKNDELAGHGTGT